MTRALSLILKETERLSTVERAELADRLFERLALDGDSEMEEVRLRIFQVESGEVEPIPDAAGPARVRDLATSPIMGATSTNI